MLWVIKIDTEPTKWTNRERKGWKNIKHNEILIWNNDSIENFEKKNDLNSFGAKTWAHPITLYSG